jgi:hypothetical protein
MSNDRLSLEQIIREGKVRLEPLYLSWYNDGIRAGRPEFDSHKSKRRERLWGPPSRGLFPWG